MQKSSNFYANLNHTLSVCNSNSEIKPVTKLLYNLFINLISEFKYSYQSLIIRKIPNYNFMF